jgi:hypothetical protein
MLKFPYGISNFHSLRMENHFYVDRTSHIRRIEEAGYQLLFLRPRRFGKSLLLSIKKITMMWQKLRSLISCLGS